MFRKNNRTITNRPMELKNIPRLSVSLINTNLWFAARNSYTFPFATNENLWFDCLFCFFVVLGSGCVSTRHWGFKNISPLFSFCDQLEYRVNWWGCNTNLQKKKKTNINGKDYSRFFVFSNLKGNGHMVPHSLLNEAV